MSWAHKKSPNTLVLFDIDGTLTLARKSASKEMLDLLAALRKKCVIGFVGGSDLSKQLEQLGENGKFTSENTFFSLWYWHYY
ncbi:Phosphomannomutase [Coelomomyces lativittatus]|nr:Phosphomannomutase [Coelomomyces lativittatus]KAJ1502353.1 Phosphomannomutase [Coelomomyces lativittatus]